MFTSGVKLPEDTIADRMRIVRTCLKLNQKDFAEKIGVYASRISEVEKGSMEPTMKMLMEIGKLGFDLNWLVTGVSKSGNIYNVVGEDAKLFKIMTNIKKLEPDTLDSITVIIDKLSEKRS